MKRSILLGAICGFLLAHVADAQGTRRPPNILFIMADDLGYGDLGCYGQREILTPHIDRLARQGTRFTQCYAGSPVCAPSRSVLMTGQHTGHTTVRGNFGKGGVRGLGGGDGRVPLAEEDITVAQGLRALGYATGMAGKWGLGEPGTSGMPDAKGFDEWMGFLNQRRAHEHYPDYLWFNGSRVDLLANQDGEEGIYAHDLFTGFAEGFIRRHADEPFFLYLPYTVPHSQFEAPALSSYADKPWSDQEKAYAAMVSRLDGHVGRLMALLEELRLERDTVVFFCSDNGAADRYDGRFDSSGVLRGRKRDMYEGGLRTPMIVRWTGRIQPGVVSGLVWGFQDFLPTALELAGATPPVEGLDGMSIAPSLLGEPQDVSERILYWEFFEGGFQQAARWLNWKVIRPEIGAPLEMYDLYTDLQETENVAPENPELVARFEVFLAAARSESPHWPVIGDISPSVSAPPVLPEEVETPVEPVESDDPPLRPGGFLPTLPVAPPGDGAG